ncbi:ABC transporter permease subunit [Sneathiella chungangensis]|uniref:ABC transporter permease subunit n=1 Tax=Sneathiella chungangensis TaxID=1418234 RepID=A0A845MCJ1_9PROT|nr:ABC transporter permease [Sneathiella chungangensis]MZR20794.1 ABC transporter permease subunit [Sneathiella chungangensis]
MKKHDYVLIEFLFLTVVSFAVPVGQVEGVSVYWWFDSAALILVLASLGIGFFHLVRGRDGLAAGLLVALGTVLGTLAPLQLIGSIETGEILNLGYRVFLVAPGLWIYVIALGLLAWRAMTLLSKVADGNRLIALAIPALFGVWLLYLWQVITTGLGIPSVLLPSPGQIGDAISNNGSTLYADFYQTVVKSVLSGFAFGCGSGFLVAVLVDRVPFMQRGLLPLGSLVSAVPIVGIAPIMVMWFGFDWESKAAVIVVMTFFPMLINTLAGLQATSHIEKDLMRSYAASYWQTLLFLRLPNAMPFIFNALKINSTLAMIGAIVAEFFGTPIVGMGFRISTEVGRMNVDIVWATIAVAAVVGSLFYGILALLERRVTFWHASYRRAK